ncbi:hypothetical protein PanWU01x14_047440 [Parasponia andersonii]|uniref:Uncharacterized protein n=1 Tax=Parasponia andersonii TaxID=3476 RepID=A0A2P5DN10_PARAD|nr:hypothetical protein PanWU01x14_047440 [Parasponia andersonii]
MALQTWSYQTIPFSWTNFCQKKEKLDSTPRILSWTTSVAPLADVLERTIFSNPNIVPMTRMDTELQHPHIKAMFKMTKDKPFVLKGKSTPVDDLDEEPHRDGNMLLFLSVAKVLSFIGEDEGKLTSSVSDLKSRISRVEEELWVVKDEVLGILREQKHMMAIMRNCENILQKIYGESRDPVISLGDNDVDVGVGGKVENFMTSVDESVKQVGNKEEKKVTGVNNEEIKEKTRKEEEEQRRRVALDIRHMEEDDVYNTNPMFSTIDAAKLQSFAADLDNVVEMATSSLMVEPEVEDKKKMQNEDKPIYDATPMVLKGVDEQPMLVVPDVKTHVDEANNDPPK